MNRTRYTTIILSLALSTSRGDIASPTPIKVNQPNGMEIEILNRGNHLQGWHEYNGWTILLNTDGWWTYASAKLGTRLIPSEIRAGVDPHPDEVSIDFVKGIRPDPFVLHDDSPVPGLGATRSDTFHVPLILVQFPDAYADYEPSLFDAVMNQEGYTHLNYDNTGSFRDFYQEISYGQFLPVAHVTDWYMAPHNHDYYAYSNPEGYPRVRQLVRDMVDSLEVSGFDWSGYDNDGDGYVDALNLIHQGHGAEQGDYNNIWSHKWSLGNLAVNYDGVTINSYNISPEKQSGNIVAIGVLAHEFGHALGLPDLYDTDYSSTGAGKLALMASGSWGTSGNSPWYPSTMIGWCKNELGWVNIVDLQESQSAVGIVQTYSSSDIYRVNHPEVPEEYWLIENRQKVGSDTLMPQPGLAIWHINDDIAQGWSPNNNEPYYGVGMEQADGMFAHEGGGPSDAGDVFPGQSDNREFSNASNPNTTSLYGAPSMVRIDNISNPGETMSFDLTYSEIILATVSLSDGTGYAYNQGSLSINLDNDMVLGEFEFEMNFSPSIVGVVDVIPTERTTFDTVLIEGQYVTLVNPEISAGTGAILHLNLFNYTGAEINVTASIQYIIGFTDQGSEVGIINTDEASYVIEAFDQVFDIQDGTGSVGGGASYGIGLANTVPLQLGVLQLTQIPPMLTPSNEPFQDENGNGEYDDGESFTDWNENGVWSPIVEPLGLNEDWHLDVTLSGTILTVAFSNWSTPLMPDTTTLFRVNCAVNEDVQLNDEIVIYTNVLLLQDAWGQNGVPFVNGEGIVTIDVILSNSDLLHFPAEFSLNEIYPNPFNPITTINYSIETYGNASLLIYDLRGRIVESLVDEILEPGTHRIQWMATNIPSGIYFAELKSGSYREIRKITLLK